MLDAPPGMLGLETAAAVAVSEVRLDAGRLFTVSVVRSCPHRRDRRCSRDSSPSAGPANVCVFDPSAVWTVDPSLLASRSRNTPYAGRTFTGRVRHTIYAGVITVDGGVAQR